MRALNRGLEECIASGEYDALLQKHELLNPLLIYPPTKWTCPSMNGGTHTGYVAYDKLSPTGTLKLALDKEVLAVGLHDVDLPWSKVNGPTPGASKDPIPIPDADVQGFDIDLIKAVAKNIAAFYKRKLEPKFIAASSCGNECDGQPPPAICVPFEKSVFVPC